MVSTLDRDLGLFGFIWSDWFDDFFHNSGQLYSRPFATKIVIALVGFLRRDLPALESLGMDYIATSP